MTKEAENIKVAVRCRPLSSRELSNGNKSIFSIQDGNACLTNPDDDADVHKYNFDLIFGLDSRQEQVFEAVGAPILEKAFSGYNATIFAYGQTGSGKTFSMQGLQDPAELRGLIPRINDSLFEQIQQKKAESQTCLFLVTCSYFEIYNEIIYDLLDPDNRNKKGSGLQVKEHGVLGIYVKGLQEIVVDSPGKMQSLIDQGMASRTVASTLMNDTSSRSHSVFTIKVHQKDAADESKNVFAKINLVDLAGSERANRTGASGAVLKEGANINKSLSALGNVINALVDLAKGKKKVFVPYRNSKLTRVLQESLGGNSLTSMLAALSPAACNFEETLGTLKYASRAKTIKVNAVKNEEASQISKLNEEITALKERLAQQTQTAVSAEAEARYKQQLADLDAALKSTWEDKAKLSAAHEEERRKLAREQARQRALVAEERARRWRLLAEKGDLLLSLAEVGEVIAALPTEAWAGRVRAALAAEAAARDQGAVVNVYKAALAEEVKALDARSPTETLQHAAGLRQLRGRAAALEGELRAVGRARAAVTEAMGALVGDVDAFHAGWQRGEHRPAAAARRGSLGDGGDGGGGDGEGGGEEAAAAAAREEGGRALAMFARQCRGKARALAAAAQGGDGEGGNRDTLRAVSALARVLEEKLGGPAEGEGAEEDGAAAAGAGGGRRRRRRRPRLESQATGLGERVALPEEERAALERTLEAATAGLSARLAEVAAALARPPPSPAALAEDALATSRPGSAVAGGGGGGGGAAAAAAALPPPESLMAGGDAVHITASANPELATPANLRPSGGGGDSGGGAAAAPCWHVPAAACDGSHRLQLDLGREVAVAAVLTQGARVLPGAAAAATAAAAAGVSGPAAPKSMVPATGGEVSLAGKGLADVNEDIEQTAEMVGQVISWEVLLKTTPPKKLLKRPPVRFLFDLFNTISKDTGYLAALMAEAKWGDLGGKAEKQAFMDRAIAQVVADLELGEAPAKGGDIVTGSETGSTNKFLQLLALAAIKSKTPTTSNQEESKAPSPRESTDLGEAHLGEAQPAWVSKYKVFVSQDGENWTAIPGSPFKGNRDATQIVRRELAEPTRCRYLRIQPSRWEGCICLRVDVEGWEAPLLDAHAEAARAAAAADGGHGGGGGSGGGAAAAGEGGGGGAAGAAAAAEEGAALLLRLLAGMQQGVDALLEEAMAFEKLENMKLEKKKEKMESLTNEKDKLEAMLSHANDQRDSLQDQNSKLTDKVNTFESENLELKNQLLKLQAEAERLRGQNAELERSLGEARDRAEGDEEKLQKLQGAAAALGAEAEERAQELEVMTEERDNARAAEEELFQALQERSEDLEQLQASYVYMTDRCNNYQDQISDLEEKLEGYQNLLSSGALLNGGGSHPSTPYSGADGPAAPAAGGKALERPSNCSEGGGEGEGEGEGGKGGPAAAGAAAGAAAAIGEESPRRASMEVQGRAASEAVLPSAAANGGGGGGGAAPSPLKSSSAPASAEGPRRKAAPGGGGGGGEMAGEEEEEEESDYDDDFDEDPEGGGGGGGDPARAQERADRVTIGSPASGRAARPAGSAARQQRPESAHRSGRHASRNNHNHNNN